MNIPSFKLFFPEESKEEFRDCVKQILDSGRLTLGPFTEKFEKEWARYVGVKHAVAVSSGTSALYIIYRYLRDQGLSDITIPTNTFAATASAAIQAGLKVRLRDMDEDAKGLAKVVVHIGGYPELIPENGLIIEDACHAHGSLLCGQTLGSFGYASAFSFYPTKLMACGEGGMLCTNDGSLAEFARCLRDQGKRDFNSNEIVRLGTNARMTEISAAMGLCQLRTLPKALERRREIARIYDQKLGDLAYRTLGLPNYYKYVVLLPWVLANTSGPMDDASKLSRMRKKREEIKTHLRLKKGISCSGEVYWPPLHMQPAFEGFKRGSYPKAEEFCSRHLCLPIYPGLEDGEAVYVAEALLGILK